MDFILKTAKRKLPLHENSFVKATAPFFDTNDENCESAKHVAIWYQRGQNTFCHNIK